MLGLGLICQLLSLYFFVLGTFFFLKFSIFFFSAAIKAATDTKRHCDNTNRLSISETDLFIELSQLIEQSKQQVAVQANSALTILFWQVGSRINQKILQNKRAEYGKQIVPTLSTQLENKYYTNFEVKNLRRMMKFAEQFTDSQIVVPLSRQLMLNTRC